MSDDFVDTLNRYIVRSGYTFGQLAGRSGLPKTTIINWANGIVRKPRIWQDVLRLAYALNMNAAETSELLHTIGQFPVSTLYNQAKAANDFTLFNLLTPWQDAVMEGHGRTPFPSIFNLKPAYVPLPKGSRILYPPNPLFTGRTQEFQSLLQCFQPEANPASNQTIALTGLGGMGKTQLVNEFIHRYGHHFPGGVFWLSFGEQAAIPTEVAACGGHEGMALRYDFDALSLAEQIQLVLRAWREPTPRLLVFDNCEEEQSLTEWRPQHGGCHIMLTARHTWWDPSLGVTQIPLQELDRADSIRLLQNFYPPIPENIADSIAAELGDLPLALHLAGRYLAFHQGTLSPAAYLQQLQQTPILSHPSLRGDGATYSPTRHQLHVAQTLAISYRQLPAETAVHQTARKLLFTAACLAPGEPIPQALLLAAAEVEVEPGQQALAEVVNLGLVTQTADSLIMHRLVAEFVQAQHPDIEERQSVARMIAQEVEATNGRKDRKAIGARQNHLRHLLKAKPLPEDETAAHLKLVFGESLTLTGHYEEAERYLRQGVEGYGRSYGTNHPQYAISLNKQGRWLQEVARRDEAERHYRAALAIQRAASQDLEATRTLTNLATVLAEKAQHDEAYTCLQETIARQRQLWGDAHLEVAANLDTLGSLLERMGRLEEAKAYLEQALAIRERILEAGHPDIGGSYNALAILYWTLGELDTAGQLWQKSLANWQESLEPDHPFVATIHNNLGAWHYKLGQKKEARAHHERALSIRMAKLGETHTDTGQSLGWLSRHFVDDGDVDMAWHYLQRATIIFAATLGEEHPRTRELRARMAEWGLRSEQ
jgi:tetratricopeptide (TPR) repeat protein